MGPDAILEKVIHQKPSMPLLYCGSFFPNTLDDFINTDIYFFILRKDSFEKFKTCMGLR
jgi:hypothetical protein